MLRRHRTLLLGVGLLFAVGTVRADVADVAADEARLKAAYLPFDGDSLVNFFRLRARGESDNDKLVGLVKALADKDGAARLKATGELVAVGSPAIPLLRAAVRDVDDVETAALARRCLAAIETDQGQLTSAAARLLAARRGPGTAEVLLAYLPHAENDAVLEEVRGALLGVTYDKGKPDPAVVKALEDEHPLRRATAITALCQGGVAEPRATLRKLLNDPRPSVRLRASLALAGAADAKAVSTLVALIGELPPDQLRDVEGFLTDLAGELGPKLPFGPDEATRLKARDAWAKWWLDTEGPGLLDELRKRTLKELDADRAQAQIEKLGDDSFEERQKAEKELVAMGQQIIPLLRQANRHPDLEVRNRAAKCLGLIEKEKPIPLSLVTPRLIALRKPAGAVEAILTYLPFVDEDSISEELQQTLNAVAHRNGKADPALLKGLEDKSPIRRVAAATALCFGPTAEHLPALRKLLKDKDPGVRLKVALALAGAREPEAVPALIAAVGELPGEASAPAEEYLTKLARDGAPKDLPEGDEGRKKRAEVWERWWAENKDRAVMADRAVAARERFQGYTLLIQMNTNTVSELGPDKKERWQLTGLLSPWDAQVLPGNRVLVAEYQGQRVTERDLKGNILWQKQLPTWPMSAERLKNGNTFIVCRNLVVEVDRAGREVRKIERPHDIMSGRRLPSGQVVIITNNRQVIRMDAAGKELKSYTVPNIFFNTNEVLDNGHLLVPLGWQNMVLEYDTEGKEVGRFTAPQPNHATRLPDGRMLVCTQQTPSKVVELDRKGKQTGEIPTTTYVFRVKSR